MLEWAVAILTLAALCIAVWELRENAKIAGQAHAREAWLKYLELGFHNPQFGSTDLIMNHLKLTNFKDLENVDSWEGEQYLWYVDIMLESCESLINFFPKDAWIETIENNIGFHIIAIRHTWIKERTCYSNKLASIVDNLV